MQPGNIDPDQRPRPAGVPEGAYWDASDNEWVLPEKNPAGQFHGLVKWWRPDGTMCCATDHVDGKPHGTFTRFHENGEPSRVGAFVKGTLQGTNVFTRSTAQTTENFPAGLGKHIWRCEMDFVNGSMTEGRLFDRENRRVMEDGTPFPTERPKGVPASAHFRKNDEGEYVWVDAQTKQVGDDWQRIGVWRFWSPEGVLVREDPYENGELHGTVRIYDADDGTLAEEQRYEAGERQFDKPAGVPDDATFDSDDETWTHKESKGNAIHGELRTWTANGTLRRTDTYVDGDITRVREFFDDGSLAQDSHLFDGGVPTKKWFRRTDEELESFPNISQEDGKEVEYTFDDHGRMIGFKITDGSGAVLEQETLYRNAHGDEEQEKFASIDAASAAWKEAGERYTSELNRWLGELYTLDEPTFEEPTFGREDLERGVLDSLTELDAKGRGGEAHAKFPLYYDGIGKSFWQRYGLVVDRVMSAGDVTYARVKYPSFRPDDVMKITGDKIEPVANLVAFGSSHDKQYTALAYEDRVEVRKGIEQLTFAYPTAYGHAAADKLERELGKAGVMHARDVRVLPNGSEVLLVSGEGIYVLSQEGAQRLYPLDATFDEYVEQFESGVFGIEMQFANADVSADGTRISCGGMFRRGIMAGLAMFRRVDGKWSLENTSQNDAFFPAAATFHRSKPHVAFAACLYASLHNALTNTTFRIDLDDLQPGEIEEFSGGISRERGRVQVIASFDQGFLLGFDNGYVRYYGVEENGQLLGYLFVGGSILDIDVAADQKSFVVASDSGLVSKFTVADIASSNLITTMKIADTARVGFFRTWPPLRW
jgi:antitoxin component YwqK of YwqJK toxin-antitoxin module